MLNLNPAKTKEMVLFNIKQKPQVPAINIAGIAIARVNDVKLVGVHVTTDLKWTTHIDAIYLTIIRPTLQIRILKIIHPNSCSLFV